MIRGRSTPRFSVLTAVYNPVVEHLTECLASVDAQRTDTVEHIVVDDHSTDPSVHALLDLADDHTEPDDTVGGRKIVRRAANGGIVAASNDALATASGEWVVLLDHDDRLASHALRRLAAFIDDLAERGRADVDLVYSDHDMIRPDGCRAEPVFKPDFSPERLRQTNYITHLVAVRRSAMLDAGGFRPGTDGAQDHDLLLRLMERGHPFAHLPAVLLHWRQSPASVATDTANKPEAFVRGSAVVQAHLDRSGIVAEVEAGEHVGTYRIRRSFEPERPVSIVIPTYGSTGTVWGAERTFVTDAVRSVAEGSTHRALEFVVVADAHTPPEIEPHLRRIADRFDVGLQMVDFRETFNFSHKINVGVAAATSDVLLILNDDTELIESESIGAMLSLLDEGADPFGSVGAVGAKLLYSDGTLQHGGHLYHGEFMHALIGWPGDHAGPQRMMAIERECAGVTAAALMTTRAVFESVGGFPEDLPLHFNDVDFCVSVRERGHRILYTPHASWYHFEGKSRSRGATIDEWNRVASRWPSGVPADPYANPNLVPKRSDWLELPGLEGAPPYFFDESGEKRWA